MLQGANMFSLVMSRWVRYNSVNDAHAQMFPASGVIITSLREFQHPPAC
jgi:hypothetical protein